jgi:hypothetical protein
VLAVSLWVVESWMIYILYTFLNFIFLMQKPSHYKVFVVTVKLKGCHIKLHQELHFLFLLDCFVSLRFSGNNIFLSSFLFYK